MADFLFGFVYNFLRRFVQLCCIIRSNQDFAVAEFGDVVGFVVVVVAGNGVVVVVVVADFVVVDVAVVVGVVAVGADAFANNHYKQLEI